MGLEEKNLTNSGAGNFESDTNPVNAVRTRLKGIFAIMHEAHRKDIERIEGQELGNNSDKNS